jgi:hypothetical protein
MLRIVCFGPSKSPRRGDFAIHDIQRKLLPTEIVRQPKFPSFGGVMGGQNVRITD